MTRSAKAFCQGERGALNTSVISVAWRRISNLTSSRIGRRPLFADARDRQRQWAVVSVHSHRSRSSGFVWRPGLIVTADEALAEEGEVTVGLPGSDSVSATVAGRDPTTDIALLRIDRTDPTPASLHTTELAAAALVGVVGADGAGPTAALGVVSLAGGPWRSMRGGEIDARLELAIPPEHRAEGGLALNAGGEHSGWLSSVLAGVSLSFQPRRSNASQPGSKAMGASRAATLGSVSSRWPSKAARRQALWS
jgi:S1-C subfamily serine protease